MRDVDRDPTPTTAPLRYLFPTTVSVPDGGDTAVVAFSTGQIAVQRGNRSIEPDALKAEREAHNSYQAGWAAIDPGGTLLVTRRDGKNVELWSITGTTVQRVAQLADGDSSEPPALAQFAPGASGITLAWSTALHYDTGTRTAVTATWDLPGRSCSPSAARADRRGAGRRRRPGGRVDRRLPVARPVIPGGRRRVNGPTLSPTTETRRTRPL